MDPTWHTRHTRHARHHVWRDAVHAWLHGHASSSSRHLLGLMRHSHRRVLLGERDTCSAVQVSRSLHARWVVDVLDWPSDGTTRSGSWWLELGPLPVMMAAGSIQRLDACVLTRRRVMRELT